MCREGYWRVAVTDCIENLHRSECCRRFVPRGLRPIARPQRRHRGACPGSPCHGQSQDASSTRHHVFFLLHYFDLRRHPLRWAMNREASAAGHHGAGKMPAPLRKNDSRGRGSREGEVRGSNKEGLRACGRVRGRAGGVCGVCYPLQRRPRLPPATL